APAFRGRPEPPWPPALAARGGLRGPRERHGGRPRGGDGGSGPGPPDDGYRPPRPPRRPRREGSRPLASFDAPARPPARHGPPRSRSAPAGGPLHGVRGSARARPQGRRATPHPAAHRALEGRVLPVRRLRPALLAGNPLVAHLHGAPGGGRTVRLRGAALN